MEMKKFGKFEAFADDAGELWINVTGFEFEDVKETDTAGMQVKIIMDFLHEKLSANAPTPSNP